MRVYAESNLVSFFPSPYITSFCSHAVDHSYEQQNGLLSQWRGYGNDERYAIVFDTKSLLKKLTEEYKKFDYTALSITDVVYNDSEFNCESRFPELLTITANPYKSLFLKKNTPDEIAEKLFPRFVTAAARFKHQGFKEEREVRIICFMSHPECIKRLYQKDGRSPPALRYKTTHIDNNIQRIHLFDWNEGRPLPIKRIIIGPHKKQKELENKVYDLTKGSIPIVTSKTPYIG